jgi:hypothetical protein
MFNKILFSLTLLVSFVSNQNSAFAVTKKQCGKDGGKWVCSAFNESPNSMCCLLSHSNGSAQKEAELQHKHKNVIGSPGAKLNCDGHVKRPDLYPRCSCCNPKPTKPVPKFI